MEEVTVESADYDLVMKMVEEYDYLVNELKEKMNLEKLTAQQYDYCFATFFQTWYGGRPTIDYDTAIKAFELITSKHMIYAMPAMFCKMTGIEYMSLRTMNAAPEKIALIGKLKTITRMTAQYKLSDSTLGQIALANHDSDIGLEYERKGAVERAALDVAKDARKLPLFKA